jgi:hypothetical protein
MLAQLRCRQEIRCVELAGCGLSGMTAEAVFAKELLSFGM